MELEHLSNKEVRHRLQAVYKLLEETETRERLATGKWHQPYGINEGRLRNVLEGRAPDDWDFK